MSFFQLLSTETSNTCMSNISGCGQRGVFLDPKTQRFLLRQKSAKRGVFSQHGEH